MSKLFRSRTDMRPAEVSEEYVVLAQVLGVDFRSYCRGSQIVFLLSLLAFAGAGQPTRAQSLVLDLAQITGPLGFTDLNESTGEFFFTDRGVSPTLLQAASYANPGQMRILPTEGIDISRFTEEITQGLGLVSDFSNQNVYAVDYLGASDPVLLSPNSGAGDNFIVSPANNLVALPVDGDSLSAQPELRDRLYTRPIVGGSATEITGGLPMFRELVGVEFTPDSSTMVVGTRDRFDNGQGVFRSSEMYLATPGATGMTQILGGMHGGIRFFPFGGDNAGDHYLIETLNINSNLPGTNMWSVPIDNPAAAYQLALRPDDRNLQLGFDNEVLDPASGQFLFSSRNFNIGQPATYSLWSEAIDGNSLPMMLTEFPARREPFSILPVENSPWIYVGLGDDLTIQVENANYYAINKVTEEIFVFSDPNGLGISTGPQNFEIKSHGSAIFFTDLQTAGNDLYIAEPEAVGEKQRVLWDVPEDQKLLRFQLSGDERFVIATVNGADEEDQFFADQLVAIPIDGGAPIVLDDGTTAEEPYGIGSSIFGPSPVGDQVFFVRSSATAGGFYIIDLPADNILNGDFDDDGDVDGADFLAWQRNPAVGNLADWQDNYGEAEDSISASSTAVPEPAGALLGSLAGCCALLLRRRV